MKYRVGERWGCRFQDGSDGSLLICDTSTSRAGSLYFVVVDGADVPSLIAGRQRSVFVCTEACLDNSWLRLEEKDVRCPDVSFEKNYCLSELAADRMTPFTLAIQSYLAIYKRMSRG